MQLAPNPMHRSSSACALVAQRSDKAASTMAWVSRRVAIGRSNIGASLPVAVARFSFPVSAKEMVPDLVLVATTCNCSTLYALVILPCIRCAAELHPLCQMVDRDTGQDARSERSHAARTRMPSNVPADCHLMRWGAAFRRHPGDSGTPAHRLDGLLQSSAAAFVARLR